MNKAEIALLISALSTGIALFSLGWNVYRDIILKPRVKVRLQVCEILTHGDSSQERPQKVTIFATNFGPREVILKGIQTKTKRLLQKTKHAFLIHDYKDPISQRFPCKLNVGEEATFTFPFREDVFLKQDFTHLGIWDSFSHQHWVPKEDIQLAKKHYQEAFVGHP